jgi:hypothetical protein
MMSPSGQLAAGCAATGGAAVTAAAITPAITALLMAFMA